jgi:hypothetical protein
MKKSNIFAIALTTATTLFLVPSVYADTPTTATGWLSALSGSGVNEDLGSLITRLINWAIGIAALISVVMLIFSGYRYITAAGDENKVEAATKTLTYSIVGLVICFIAVILVKFVLTSVLKTS